MKEVVVFLSGLFFGTGTSILAKTMFLIKVQDKYYIKPLFQTFLMFLGMFSGVPIFYFLQRFKRKPEDNEYQALEDGDQVEESTFNLSYKTAFLLAIPSCFDLVGTVLAKEGLIYIDVSVYQLIRCALIVCVAFVRWLFLSAIFSKQQKLGIMLNTVAVGLVASTSFFEINPDINNSSAAEKFFGVFLVLLSCMVQSMQYVLEEKLMSGDGHGKSSVHPLLIVGMEGFWGLVFNVFLILPIAYMLPGSDCSLDDSSDCRYENTFDSFDMMASSRAALTLSIVYTLVIAGYNIFAVYVTFFLDSVWHAILDNFRPVSIWLTQLILFKLLSGQFGEKWTNASFLQLAGLILLLYGTAVYNENIIIKRLQPSESGEQKDQHDVDALERRTSLLTTSPLLSKYKESHHEVESD